MVDSWRPIREIARQQQVPLPLLRTWALQRQIRTMMIRGEYWADLLSVQRHMLRVALDAQQRVDDEWLLLVDCAGCGVSLVAPGQAWLVRVLQRQHAGPPLPAVATISRGSRHYCAACVRQGVWRG